MSDDTPAGGYIEPNYDPMEVFEYERRRVRKPRLRLPFVRRTP